MVFGGSKLGFCCGNVDCVVGMLGLDLELSG